MPETVAGNLHEMEEQVSPWLTIDTSNLHRVLDPDQAAVIADPVRSVFLRPFLSRENTVTQAAGEVGCSPNAMLYRVRRMHAIDILRVVRTEPRAGRAVKVYRSAHDGYFVPNEVMRYDDLRHQVARHGRVLVNRLIDSYVAVLADTRAGGRVLARNDRGESWATDLLPEVNRQGQPAFFVDADVRLTGAEATQVRELLRTALERSVRPDRSEGPAGENPKLEQYLFTAGILPLRDERSR